MAEFAFPQPGFNLLPLQASALLVFHEVDREFADAPWESVSAAALLYALLRHDAELASAFASAGLGTDLFADC
jgi:hypothetical protein